MKCCIGSNNVFSTISNIIDYDIIAALIQETEIWCQKLVLPFQKTKFVQLLICRRALFRKSHLYSERRQYPETNDTFAVILL